MDFLRFFIPSGLLSLGAYLQARDANRTGVDDAIGQIASAIAPAIGLAFEPDTSNNRSAVRRIMTTIRDAAQSYLDQNPQ